MYLRRIFSHLGLDGVLLGVAGFAGIVIGILDFTPVLNLTNDPMLRMLLSGIGLLLTAVVAQTSRRKAEISELREAMGLMEVEVLEPKRALPQHLIQRIAQARRFFLYTNLNREALPELDTPGSEYRPVLDKRLKKGSLSFRRVDIVSSEEALENVIRQLLKHEQHEFFVRHYDPPPKPIPTLNISSFDNEHFYLGGFSPTEFPTEAQVIYIRHPEVSQFLRDYWQMVWLKAIPLNEGRHIDWTELRRISSRVGMTESEFDTMVEQLRNEVSLTEQKAA